MEGIPKQAIQSVLATVLGSYVGSMVGGDMGHAAGVAMANYFTTRNIQAAAVAGVVAYGINVTVKEDIVKALAAQEGITLNEDDLDKVANSMSAAAASLGVHMVFV